MDIIHSKTVSFQSQTFSTERHNIECHCQKNFEFTISHIISMYLSGELLSHFLPGDEHIIEGIKLKLDKLSNIPNDKLSLLSESIDQVILSFCAKLHQIPQTEILLKAERLKNSKISSSKRVNKIESPRMVGDIPIKHFGEKQEVSIHTESLGQMIEEEQAKGLPVLFILTRYFGNNEDQYLAWNLNEESLQVNKYPLHKRVEPYSELRYKQSAQELKLLNNFDNLFLYLRRAYAELCEIAGKSESELPDEEESMEKILIGILKKIEKLKYIHKIIRKKCSIFKERLHEKEFNIGFKERRSEMTSEEYKHTNIIWDTEDYSENFCEKSTQIPDFEDSGTTYTSTQIEENKEDSNKKQECIINKECEGDELNSHKIIKTVTKTQVFEAQRNSKNKDPNGDDPNPENLQHLVKKDEIKINETTDFIEESKNLEAKLDVESSNQKDKKININLKSFSTKLTRGLESEPETLNNINPNEKSIEEPEKEVDKSCVDSKEEDNRSKEIKTALVTAKTKSLKSDKYKATEVDAPIAKPKADKRSVDNKRNREREENKSSDFVRIEPLKSEKYQTGENYPSIAESNIDGNIVIIDRQKDNQGKEISGSLELTENKPLLSEKYKTIENDAAIIKKNTEKTVIDKEEWIKKEEIKICSELTETKPLELEKFIAEENEAPIDESKSDANAVKEEEANQSKEIKSSLGETEIKLLMPEKCQTGETHIQTVDSRTEENVGDIKSEKTKSSPEEAGIKTLKLDKYQIEEIYAPIVESKTDENSAYQRDNYKSEDDKTNLFEDESKSLETDKDKTEKVDLQIVDSKADENFIGKEEDIKARKISTNLEKVKIKNAESEKYQTKLIDAPNAEPISDKNTVDKEEHNQSEEIKTNPELPETIPLEKYQIRENNTLIEDKNLKIENSENVREAENLLFNMNPEKERSFEFNISSTSKINKTSFSIPATNEIQKAKTIDDENKKEDIKSSEVFAVIDESQTSEVDEQNKNLNYQIKKTTKLKSSSIPEEPEPHDLSPKFSSKESEIVEKSEPIITDAQLSLNIQTTPSEIKAQEINEDLQENIKIPESSKNENRSIGISIKKNSKISVNDEETKNNQSFEIIAHDKNEEEKKESDLDKQRAIATKLSKTTKEIVKTNSGNAPIIDGENKLKEEPPNIPEEIKISSNPSQGAIEKEIFEEEENTLIDKLDQSRKLQALLTKTTKQIRKPKIEIDTSELTDQIEESSPSNAIEDSKSNEPFDALRDLKTQLTKKVRQIIKKKTVPKTPSKIESKEEKPESSNELNQNAIDSELPIDEVTDELESGNLDEAAKKRKIVTKLQKKTRLVVQKIKVLNAVGKLGKSDPPTPSEISKTASLRDLKTPSPLPEDTDLSFPNRNEEKRKTQF